jgi:hypothetical protein
MDWMGLEKIKKKFDLFGIKTHPIPLNPHGLRANQQGLKCGLAFEAGFGHLSWNNSGSSATKGQ